MNQGCPFKRMISVRAASRGVSTADVALAMLPLQKAVGSFGIIPVEIGNEIDAVELRRVRKTGQFDCCRRDIEGPNWVVVNLVAGNSAGVANKEGATKSMPELVIAACDRPPWLRSLISKISKEKTRWLRP